MQAIIKKAITEAVQKEFGGIEIPDFSLEIPENPEHGDYASNAPLVLGKILKKNPMEIGKTIGQGIKNQELWEAEVVAPGFLNFKVSQEVLAETLAQILKQGENYGQNKKLSEKKIMIEFTDPNPFKEFHIGHLYTNIVGESLARLLGTQGALVKRGNYQGDVGLHVAKAIWGIQKKIQIINAEFQILGEKSLHERIRFIGEAYVLGASAYEEDEAVKEAIIRINKMVYDQNPEIREIYEKGRAWSLEYFEEIYKRLGTKFDYYYFESEVGKEGLEIVNENLKKGIFEKSDGAVIFPGEKYGLHRRVFINSQGLPTYEAKELGLISAKFRDFPFDLSISVTGNEIIEYFKVLIAAIKEVNRDLGQKILHISHGMVRKKEGKMASRKGNILKGEDLLDEVKGVVLQRMENQEFPDSEKKEIAEKIALAAVKYSLLKVGLGKDIIFDIETSLNLKGDSGPYIQYTGTRLKSILSKTEGKNSLDFGRLQKESERLLMRHILHYSEILERAAKNYSPQFICEYLFRLADLVNSFYEKEPVLKAETREIKEARLGLVSACLIILSSGLKLLGISIPEEM